MAFFVLGAAVIEVAVSADLQFEANWWFHERFTAWTNRTQYTVRLRFAREPPFRRQNPLESGFAGRIARPTGDSYKSNPN
jgi:hypothetical protein